MYWSHSLLVIAGVMLQIPAATSLTLVSHSRVVSSPLAVARACPPGAKDHRADSVGAGPTSVHHDGKQPS
jgi:hypothetical protein